MGCVSSDNPIGADNQQERPGFEQWVVGFVDGEGCFSVPIFRNPTCRLGWQVQPEFTVVQGARSMHVLHELKRFFGCGQVGRNGRHDNHREDLFHFRVRSLGDHVGRVIPFFVANPLKTAKRGDFGVFADVVSLMAQRLHLTPEGLRRIAEMTQSANRKAPSRFLESSEAIRQPPLSDGRGEEMVLAAWRHAED